MITVFGRLRSGWSSGSGSSSKTSRPAPAIVPWRSRGHERGFVDDGAARGIDQVGGRLHLRELAGAEEPARAVAEHEMNAHDVRAREQLVLGHQGGADFGGARGGEILAPGDHLHLEGAADLGDPRAQRRRARRRPSVLPFRPSPTAHLPAAFARRAVLGRDTAEEGEDQSPRQLGRRVGKPGGAADHDLALGRRCDVDRGVAHARRDQELQPREPFEQRARKRRALAHGHHRVEVGEPLGHRLRVAQVVGEDRRRPSRRGGSSSRPCDGRRPDSRRGSRLGPCQSSLLLSGATPSNSPSNH